MPDFDRKDLISLATICLDLGLFKDSIAYWKLVVKMSTPLNEDERTLLFVSYMNISRDLRNFRCKLMDKENVQESFLSELLGKIDRKHDKICDEAIELIDSYWVKRDENPESVVDYNFFKVTQHYDKLILAGEKKIVVTS